MQLGVYLIYGNMRDMKMTDFPTYPWETLHHVSGQQLLLQYPSWPTCRWRFIRRFQDEAGIIQQKITCADNLCMRPLQAAFLCA